VVVAVAGWLILVQPLKSQASSLQSRITTARSHLAQAEATVLAGETAEAEYKRYASQLSAVATAVPSDVQVPRLIVQLQAAADRNHTGFQTVSLTSSSSTPATSTPASALTSSALPSQGLSLEFTGGYFAVARLLGTLASFVKADNDKFSATGRLLTINSVSFAAGPGGFPKVSASVTASDYDIPAALGLGTTSADTATATPAADITGK
jgi:Tfp pilus assembly protein PilO